MWEGLLATDEGFASIGTTLWSGLDAIGQYLYISTGDHPIKPFHVLCKEYFVILEKEFDLSLLVFFNSYQCDIRICHFQP